MSYDLLEIRAQRSDTRTQNRIEEVLAFAAKKGVTLVELEKLAHLHVSRHEEVQQARKKIHQRANHHLRALNANRVRWQRAKDFLEGHVSKDERTAKRIESVGPMAHLLEGKPIPQPEAPFIPTKELF